MEKVRAKKHLGQHFLHDENTAIKIANLINDNLNEVVLEIGPGMGVLTKHLLSFEGINLLAVEIDSESIVYLNQNYESLRVVEQDFLKMNFQELAYNNISIIGNFPYNISSQILFKAIENRDKVKYFAGMFQREMAQRICASHGSKEYGILSVLAQAYYDINYCFTVSEGVFTPPPKVKSGVIKMKRKEQDPACDYETLRRLVKLAFNQRRKMLSNSIKTAIGDKSEQLKPYLNLRPEQLTVTDFIDIAIILG